MGYLFAAYTIIFIAIFLYVVFIWRRQAALEDQVRSVQAKIRDLSAPAPAAPAPARPQSAPSPASAPR